MNNVIKPFLYSVAETYYEEYKHDIHRVRFVFPNRRAGVFFQKYLASFIDKTIFLPEITTINAFISDLSGLEALDNLDLMFELYTIYAKASGIEESFDEFYFWGNILLSDFDEIDKFLVDAKLLYSNILSIKEIEAAFAGLEPEQVEAIQAFWSNFQDQEQTGMKDVFLRNWEVLFPVYKQFKSHLLEKQSGYNGLIYREIAEKMRLGTFDKADDKITVFAGFNALNTCEETIFDYFRKEKKAEFCWDFSGSKFMKAENHAAAFMQKYMLRYPQKKGLALQHNDDVIFESVAVPSVTGQAYLCADLLRQSVGCSPEELTKKVIILSDESLLANVLYSIPEALEPLNITMGYPVKSSISIALLSLLVKLQKNSRGSGNNVVFNSRDVLDIIQHEWIKTPQTEATLETLANFIVDRNLIYWKPAKPFENPLLNRLFEPLNDARAMLPWLTEIMEALLDAWFEEKDEDDAEEVDGIRSIENEMLLFLTNVLVQLTVQLQKNDIQISRDILARIISRATESLTIPFEGEPLSGLQIMGVLETRVLDFEEIIFLSFNERVFPRKTPDNTFIPYNLRKGYGLTTVEYHDAMYAYYFYRLLQRAKKVTMVYNTSQSGMSAGEPSRYYLQLKYLYQLAINEHVVAFKPGAKASKEIVIKASDETQELLQKYLAGGGKFLSVTALNSYIDCSLKFYFMYLKGLREEDELAEEIDARVFGSIYHQAIEELYKPYEKQLLSAENIQEIRKSPLVDHQIRVAMAQHYFKCDVSEVVIKGQFQIIFNVLKKYLLKTLEIDKSFAPFVYKKGELEVGIDFEVTKDLNVRLGGYIDRLDEVNNEIRIIDYKTGKAEKAELSFSEIEDVFIVGKKRPKYVFQTFFYMMIYNKLFPDSKMRPGIYFLRNLYADPFLWEVMRKNERKYEPIANFSSYLEVFEEHLKVLLHELFVEKNDFVQTEELENCTYCPFKTVCMR